MGTIVFLYILGMLVAGSVYRVRAGAGFWHRLQILGDRGFGLDWFLLTAGKMLVWPVVLTYWLANDRPEPRMVFNEKAEERKAAAERTQMAAQLPSPVIEGALVLGRGRRLRSSLDVAGCVRAMERSVDDSRADVPRVLPATCRWLGDGPAPDTTVVGLIDRLVVVAAFRGRPDGTEIVLVPADRRSERAVPLLIERWGRIDRFVAPFETTPASQLALFPPTPPSNLVEDTIGAAGFTVTPETVAAVSGEMRDMVAAKAHQFIAGQDPARATRFVECHRTSAPAVVLDELARWDADVVPYIQDLYLRVRAILLERGPDGELGAVVWKAGPADTLTHP